MSIRIKDYVKRAISTALIATTVLTSVITSPFQFNTIEVQAATGVSGDGNTGGGTSSMGSSNKYYAWQGAALGYRMYIVGTDGKIASIVNMF